MKRTTCRVCLGSQLTCFLSLGETPLANAFLTEQALSMPEPRFPLDVYFCEGCGLVQLLEVVPAKVLFRRYIYFSSTSDTIRQHAYFLAEKLTARFALRPGNDVVEIASNDGCFLKPFRERGMRVLGIEPATNIAEVARKEGVETLNEFFTPTLATHIKSRPARVRLLLSRHVLGHVDDLHGFVEGAARLLEGGGVWVIEVPYLVDLLENNEFDTIYHEHLSYFSIHPLEHLLKRFALSIFDIQRIPIHGGAILVYIQGPSGQQPIMKAVAEFRRAEQKAQLATLTPYADFAQRVREIRIHLPQLLRDFKSQGKRLAGYGAPAKGNTLLNTCGITKGLLDFLADKSVYKQGFYAPGSHLPVVSPDRIAKDKPNALLLLAWNFAEEIFRQQADYLQRGGKFIVPIPEPRIVEAKDVLMDKARA